MSRRYTPEQVDRGLLAYAITGNYATACDMLKAQGLTLPRSTLKHWVKKLHNARYIEISNEHAGQYLEVLKADYREIVKQSGEATLEGIEKTRADFSKLEPRDQSTALRNLATTAAIAFDKLSALEGRPTTIVQHEASADDLLLKVKAILGGDWQPEPIDATVVEDDPSLTIRHESSS